MALQATQSIQFEPAADGPALQLELDDKLGLAPAGSRPLRLYPPVAAEVSASVGSAVLSSVFGTRRRARELLVFAGSNRASPQYPPTRLVKVLLRHSLKVITGNGFQPVSLGANDFKLDPSSGDIVCSRAVYGPVLLDYDADYRLIYYTPATQTSGYYGGQSLESGTVYAFYQGRSVTREVPYSRQSAQLRGDLYVAYSHAVVDAEFQPGSINGYEMPEDWPSDESYYALQPSAEVPDPAASATIERPHRIGEYDLLGSIWETNKYPAVLTPYRGFSTYRPKIWVRFADPPAAGSRLEDGYQRAIAEKSRILQELADLYPKFQGEAS